MVYHPDVQGKQPLLAMVKEGRGGRVYGTGWERDLSAFSLQGKGSFNRQLYQPIPQQRPGCKSKFKTRFLLQRTHNIKLISISFQDSINQAYNLQWYYSKTNLTSSSHTNNSQFKAVRHCIRTVTRLNLGLTYSAFCFSCLLLQCNYVWQWSVWMSYKTRFLTVHMTIINKVAIQSQLSSIRLPPSGETLVF